MKRITILFAFFALALHVQGANVFPDTAQPKKPWKISKQEFLDRYGKDDTSRALIQYFLTRRKAGQILTIGGASLTTGLSIGLGKIVADAKRPRVSPDGLGGLPYLFIIVFLASTVGTTVLLTLAGLYLWIAYPRKRLWRILNNYLSGKGIPAHLKSIFRKGGMSLRNK